MVELHVAPAATTVRDAVRRGRGPWLVLLLAVANATSYASLLVPYYANGLHRRPAGQSLQVHDLGALWPYDTVLGVPFTMAAAYALLLAPFVAMSLVVWTPYLLWTHRRASWPAFLALGLALAVASVTVAWLTTPLCNELVVWFFD